MQDKFIASLFSIGISMYLHDYNVDFPLINFYRKLIYKNDVLRNGFIYKILECPFCFTFWLMTIIDVVSFVLKKDKRHLKYIFINFFLSYVYGIFKSRI